MMDVANGNIIQSSPLKFQFSFPYVQMTTDVSLSNTFIVSYPDGYEGAVLYELDDNLELSYMCDDDAVNFNYFDLQYSFSQSTLYGIKVISSYGRALSNFTVDYNDNNITARELFELPYMWYVNASSFDHSNSIYFGLINNFQGFSNSTLDQQLVIADFSVSIDIQPPFVQVIPLQFTPSTMILQFVSYSEKLQSLFALGISSSTAHLVIIDTFAGSIQTTVVSIPAVIQIGPLVTDEISERIAFFVKTSSSPSHRWELRTVSYNDLEDVRIVRVFEGDGAFIIAAAVSL